MHDRPAVVVRLEDSEGLTAWGEIWCNFPSVGAEHRARLFNSTVAPILLEQAWDSPQTAFKILSTRLHILGIQCGEPGTIAQAIAGADIALWDLFAKKSGQALWHLFGGSPNISTYASGLSPTHPEKLAQQKWDEGYRAFKLKVGFGTDRDFKNLETLRNIFGDDIHRFCTNCTFIFCQTVRSAFSMSSAEFASIFAFSCTLLIVSPLGATAILHGNTVLDAFSLG
jgi:L-alanine-DL-glutamate epimerase-like enolase superfamily enzyme